MKFSERQPALSECTDAWVPHFFSATNVCCCSFYIDTESIRQQNRKWTWTFWFSSVVLQLQCTLLKKIYCVCPNSTRKTPNLLYFLSSSISVGTAVFSFSLFLIEYLLQILQSLQQKYSTYFKFSGYIVSKLGFSLIWMSEIHFIFLNFIIIPFLSCSKFAFCPVRYGSPFWVRTNLMDFYFNSTVLSNLRLYLTFSCKIKTMPSTVYNNLNPINLMIYVSCRIWWDFAHTNLRLTILQHWSSHSSIQTKHGHCLNTSILPSNFVMLFTVIYFVVHFSGLYSHKLKNTSIC